MYDMPPVYDHSERQVDKVSTLKSFLKSCLELMKDESALSMLHGMIDHCTQEKEIPFTHRAVNQVHHKKRMNREFRLNAQIGNYDMDNIILDLGLM
jgi:hypothetical protein